MPCNERFISLSPAQLSASPYESVMGPRCVTPHLCYPLEENSETLLAFSCPLAATPLRGLLDQNKLKKALWTLAVFNLSPSLVLTPALSLSPFRPPFFMSCFLLLYIQEKKRETCSFLVPCITSRFNSFIATLAPALHPTLKHLQVFISRLSLSSSRFYTFSPCRPFFVRLSSLSMNVLFLTVLTVPSHYLSYQGSVL